MVATLLECVAMDAYNKILPWFKRRKISVCDWNADAPMCTIYGS